MMSVTRQTALHNIIFNSHKTPVAYYYHMTVEESEFNEGYSSHKDDGASGGNPSLSSSKDLLLNTIQYLPVSVPCPIAFLILLGTLSSSL